MSAPQQAWYRALNRYHWFVLIVAALGWLFDTMDQQLFNLARVPAMKELLAKSPGDVPSAADISHYGGIATAVFLMGWATGGLVFGILGDRIGRAKTMMLTILVYSICTGLNAFSHGFWDFTLFRFLTGLGVGGEFAVGVALVAEVMPAASRPYALGFLQALSAVGNVGAALINIYFGYLEQQGVFTGVVIFGVTITMWRAMFMVGAIPALLALVIRRRLKEPAQWQAAASSEESKKSLGSYRELFGNPLWRRRAIVGMLMAASGVIGLWGIVFFSIDLSRSVFGKVFEQEARAAGEVEADRDFVRLVLRDPSSAGWADTVDPADLINSNPTLADARPLFTTIRDIKREGQQVSAESVLGALDAEGQTQEQRAHRADYLSGEPAVTNGPELAKSITTRSVNMRGKLTKWVGYLSMTLNIGAFFGIYGFTLLTSRIGRKPTFAIAFIASGLSTALVFWKMDSLVDIFWMVPLMGFCILSLFGGYAIYFPELFPTRLRSTGTSFCYNVGRFVAAIGPYTLGLLTSKVFISNPEPLRPAGMTMCLIFLVGLMALPFADETKDKPLPE